MPKENTRSRVAVVGAGIAGLTCASALADYGIDVTVYEKSRGVGGRTSTRRVEPGLAFDHGAQYFTARTPKFLKLVESLKQRGCVAEWGGRIVKLEKGLVTDTNPQSRFVGVPGMTAVAAHLAKDLTICRGEHIDRISRSDGAWELSNEIGTGFGPFDFLVLTLPAPQSAALLQPHPFAAEVAEVVMSPCWAVLVAFQDRLEVPWDAAFVSGSALSWVARNSSKPGRPAGADCWVLHASPEWSSEFLEHSSEFVATNLLKAFEAATGQSLPRVDYLAAHRWKYSLGADPAEKGVFFDAEAGLAVCGDWLSGGRVEGAFLSGMKSAESILADMGIPL